MIIRCVIYLYCLLDLSDSCREIHKDMSSNLGVVLLTFNSLYFMRWYDLGKVIAASSDKENITLF